MADHYRNDLVSVGDGALPDCGSLASPKTVFDGVDALLQPGTNNERRLNPKNRIALQIFISFDEQMRDEGAIARRADHEMNVRRPETDVAPSPPAIGRRDRHPGLDN